MDIVEATRGFEGWLAKRISVVPHQLADKHAEMADSSVSFLRGTFYRWAQMFPQVCGELAGSTQVMAVGDLHIASFGTWRDEFGRLIWGIDDFDEAHPLGYANDLVRLAASAVIDARAGELKVGIKNVCEVVIDGYGKGLAAGGRAFVLEERHAWLREHALALLDKPRDFWRKMDALPALRTAVPEPARKALARLLPDPRISCRIVRRVAGVGSLGHPRYVAIFDWKWGQLAIEAKQASPSACAWAKPGGSEAIHYQQLLNNAVRCQDPFVRLSGQWLVHQLSPDSSPLEIESLNGIKNQDRLLHAMAWEAANVHLGTAGAAKRVAADLRKRPAKMWRSAVKEMATQILDDWRDWKRAYKNRSERRQSSH
jgi:Uncharacterized protein conserved in bacteria